MLSATPQTLSTLSSVLGFDVIEYWTPDENNELRCLHYFLSDSVKQVVKRIFPEETAFSPALSDPWRINSLQVIIILFSSFYFLLFLFLFFLFYSYFLIYYNI